MGRLIIALALVLSLGLSVAGCNGEQPGPREQAGPREQLGPGEHPEPPGDDDPRKVDQKLEVGDVEKP